MFKYFGFEKTKYFIVTFQEAFTAIIPVFLITSFLNLFYSLMKYLNIDFYMNEVKLLSSNFASFSSLVATVSIAYFLANRLRVSQIMAMILSLSTFITLTFLYKPVYPINLPFGFNFTTILNPFLATVFLKYFFPVFSLKISLNDGNYHIYRLFNYLFVFLFAFIATIIVYMVGSYVVKSLFFCCALVFFKFPDFIVFMIRDFLVQLSWFFGIHGEHFVNALIGKSIIYTEVFPNLTFGEFNRLFVIIGGAGCGLALLISLFRFIKDNNLRILLKISSPFVIFNINTLLIYAVIVLNRFFIIPFLFLPLFNIVIAYFFLQVFSVNFSSYYVEWTTPIFLNAYLKSNGNLWVSLLQMGLIFVDTYFYVFFVRKFAKSNYVINSVETLKENLEISDEIKSKENILAFQARKELIEASAKLSEIVDNLKTETLFVYFQPKIDIIKKQCFSFETLIRYNDNGQIKGPFFIEIIEKAGLAPIIDIWVCREVKKTLNNSSVLGFYPQVSINLHPDTLKDKNAINSIIKILKGENIIFEIIERSFVNKEAEDNLLLLKKNDFEISLDDFGTGYSSLETLTKYKIDELKIDKGLIKKIEDEKNYIVCKYIVEICHNLGIKVVAEGIETKKQLDIVKSINVDFVQGFYFSQAVAFDDIKNRLNEWLKLI